MISRQSDNARVPAPDAERARRHHSVRRRHVDPASLQNGDDRARQYVSSADQAVAITVADRVQIASSTTEIHISGPPAQPKSP